MRAEAIRFEDIFQIDPLSGRISLGTDRYIMLDADALGNMRRELIDNLGWEVARGILERVGYQVGQHNARQLRERYPWTSEEEWLRAGPRLHYLEGMVKVRLEEVEINRSEGKLSIIGEWRDSYEADQHLRYYGPGVRPVCWSLEGHATGYASEFFGKEVVCLETHCRGKGDPICRFALRPLQEWGKTARPLQEMLLSARFTERFDRCLRIISDRACELEQTSLDAIITTDARGFITSCSQGASQMLGLQPNEAVGKKVSSFYGGGIPETQALMEHLYRRKRIRNYFTEIVTPSGRKTPIALSASAIHNRKGKIVGTIGVAHDLTEIRRLEDELATQNRFMANILRDSADAIITMDSNDVITSWNKGAESIFGYLASEMINRSVAIIVPPELREARELEQISQRFRAQGAIRSYQTERITKDGKRIKVIFTRTAILDDSGKVIGSSVVLKDVTAYKNLEKQLAYAEHLATLGELSAGLAHEIKNPLAGIKGAIDVIRDSMSPTDGHREILGDVIHEVDRIDKIVRDLLNYAKPKPPSHSSINLPEMVQRIVTMTRTTSKNEALSIEVKQLTEIPPFTGDEIQLEQVLLNLLLNSQNAIVSAGNIQVLLSYINEEKAIHMEVNDDGPGIPEEAQKRIFQPFFTTRTDGTGLGLAICHKNVQYHGGTIEVHSQVGRGTTFVVTIPLLNQI